MSPAPTSTADGAMTPGDGGVGSAAGAGSGVGTVALATEDGAVGADVNADPPQAQKITAQLNAAPSDSHLEGMSAAELNMVVTVDALAFMRRFRARYDFSCLYSYLETAFTDIRSGDASWTVIVRETRSSADTGGRAQSSCA